VPTQIFEIFCALGWLVVAANTDPTSRVLGHDTAFVVQCANDYDHNWPKDIGHQDFLNHKATSDKLLDHG
jgi:hypothetical protein